MPLMGPIPEGRSFFCPHCGALYSVTDTRRPKNDTEKCVVCLQVMDESDSNRFSAYKLIHRPEDAEPQLARPGGEEPASANQSSSPGRTDDVRKRRRHITAGAGRQRSK